MFVTESAADTVLLATDDDPLRALVGQGLRSVGFVVLDGPDAAVTLDLLRRYSAAIEWLIVDTKQGYTCPGLHAALEFRFLNPFKPVVCLVDDEAHPALLRLPDVILVRKPVRNVGQVIDVMRACRLAKSEDLVET